MKKPEPESPTRLVLCHGPGHVTYTIQDEAGSVHARKEVAWSASEKVHEAARREVAVNYVRKNL